MTDHELIEFLKARACLMPLSEGGCWLWAASCTPNGYPQYHMKGKTYYAHREIMRAHGHDIEGVTVDHLCFETSCINPKHLMVCSAAENTRRARSDAWRNLVTSIYGANSV